MKAILGRIPLRHHQFCGNLGPRKKIAQITSPDSPVVRMSGATHQGSLKSMGLAVQLEAF